MSDFFWFSDAQWARIEPLLPTGQRGKRRVDDRPRSERDCPCAALWGPLGGLRGGVWAEKGRPCILLLQRRASFQTRKGRCNPLKECMCVPFNRTRWNATCINTGKCT